MAEWTSGKASQMVVDVMTTKGIAVVEADGVEEEASVATFIPLNYDRFGIGHPHNADGQQGMLDVQKAASIVDASPIQCTVSFARLIHDWNSTNASRCVD
jgi:hypothetical protein